MFVAFGEKIYSMSEILVSSMLTKTLEKQRFLRWKRKYKHVPSETHEEVRGNAHIFIASSLTFSDDEVSVLI